MRSIHWALGALLTIVCVGQAAADERSNFTQLRNVTGVSLGSDTSPDARSSAPTRSDTINAVINIDAATNNNRATLKLQWTKPVTDIHSGHDWMIGSNNFTFALSAPIGQGGDSTNVIASGGLPSDFRATLGFSHFLSKTEGYDEDKLIDLYKQAMSACDGFNTREKHVSAQRNCDKNADELVDENLSNAQKRAYQEALGTEFAFAFGLEGNVGYQKFAFLDPAFVTKMNSSRTPWSAKAYIGVVPWNVPVYVLGAIEYENVYKAGATGTLCLVPPPGPVLTCQTGAVGAPTFEKSFVASLEARWQSSLPFGSIGLSSVGFSPKFAYDTNKNVYGFDLPITFVQDSKKNLVGGLRIGWQSDEHDFIAGLFVGSAFSLLGG